MLASPGATVRFNCPACGYRKEADLVKLVRVNPMTSLWNRHPKCPACGKPGFFNASPSDGTPLYPLATDDLNQTTKLHQLAEMVRKKLREL